MKVCVVYGSLPPSSDGGADFCLELARGIRAAGADVSLVTGRRWPGRGGLDGIEVHPLISEWGWRGILGGDFKALRDFFSLNRFDITIAIYPCAGAGKNYLLPCLIPLSRGSGRFRLIWFTPVAPRSNAMELAAAAILALRAERIFSEDAEVAEKAKRYVPFLSGKVSWIPLGSNLAFDSPNATPREQLRKRLNMDADAYYVSFFGYWYRSKGVDLLVRAVLKVNDALRPSGKRVVLVLAGGRNPGEHTEYERSIVELIRGLNMQDSVLITGTLPMREVGQMLLASDLYVLPFRRFFTARSSLVPAIELGLPLVLCNRGERAGHLRHLEHAFLVPPDDEECLKGAILEMLGNPDLRRRMAARIRELRKFYNWQYVVKEVLG
jgi:glycosyltransferase involved in cell wall biosynthesis